MTVGMSLRCEDCGRVAPVPDHPDAPALLRQVREFVAEHSDCSFAVSFTLPSPRGPAEAVIDLTQDVHQASRQ